MTYLNALAERLERAAGSQRDVEFLSPRASLKVADLRQAAQALRWEPVAWRFKFASSPSWSYREDKPPSDWADQCRHLEPLFARPALKGRDGLE